MKRWLDMARRLGWPAALALLLTLAAVVGAAWLPREQQRLDAERQHLASRRAALQPRASSSIPTDGGAALAASLPPDAERQARTAALLALTTELGLPWPRSEFRYQADRELGLAQYRVAMQLSGRYSTLRGFVAEALRRDPALALETLRLRRDADGQLKAELAWVLHMQVTK
ncbi:hypothetical protein [Roseateles saccharophilus]|uniref:Type II secretion system (T2SS) protein M subtype b n=1 Tax=Roseateles saccharophilus TaxID=304 RepID=A0A4R3UYR4_ROSSA|nr:hypothetical protein [Roseateles saccharophilus]MDG0833071.1 hypothetical protein [Roseateles saccharophilus]TCU96270.1 hypothetical protein EV671_101337 [Roseateles saccharophilus]